MVTAIALKEVNKNRQGFVHFNHFFSFNLKSKNGKRSGYKK